MQHTGRVVPERDARASESPNTPPPGSRTGRPRRPGRTWRDRHPGWVYLFLALGVLAVAVVLIPFLFFHVIEGSAPGKLHLPASGPGSGPIVPGPVSGTWTVSTGSEAGYRVDEILFGQHHTAVGRTTKVSGSLLISGDVVAAGAFSVDMASVKSDQISRDVQFRDYILSTDKYPHATFRLTRPIELASIPAPGQVLTATATGDLTLRGVTRPINFPVHAERTATGIDVNAEIPVTFSTWHIPNPSFVITKVANSGLLEVLLDLRQSATH
jgi:polyisoprenoid-binding protein YceI